ncbi:polyphosphate polymerase domain-containing protein [Nonomuraea sp. 10N515B]|uniref:polyphosphate polymerase domain-containing protein n=1 Tax=Nonomuraea sp. 10N515B TaxID=3457422 RepID=UPI003FCE24DF
MDAAIDTLSPIGLDELVDRAALLTRLDRKYVLPMADLPILLGGLPDDVKVLEIDNRREFGYRSVYFDTPDLDGYLAAARRRRRRFKLRIRTYVDSDQHFLEVKTRGRRGATIKHRMPYDGDRGRLGPAARAYVHAVLADARIHPGPVRFIPVLTTCYRRTTLFVPATGSRVTIDTGLTWALSGGPAVQIAGHAIVETKSDRAASEVDRLLWSLRHRPCPMSKYATGLAALRPDLPANRWHLLLRRHFHPTTDGT